MEKFDGIQNPAVRNAVVAIAVVALIGMVVLALFSVVTGEPDAPKHKYPGMSETTINLSEN